MNRQKLYTISLLIIAALISIAVLTSCKCRTCQDQEQDSVPLEILTKADSFIITSTGKEFF
ncbi:MAG: hypothetical protein KJZ60_10575, partial [Ignavibacteriaceae bacterium]|nr:hypothetical protein [Ignavibacteriaceae bacterium]